MSRSSIAISGFGEVAMPLSAIAIGSLPLPVLGRARITLRARFSQDSAMAMRGLEMKPRSRVSTVSGIPKSVRLRATALRGRDSALATPNLNAARTPACPVAQWFQLAHGRLILGLLFFTIKIERFRPRVNVFSCDS